MKTETIQAIQSSWRKVVPIADTVAELFYQRLFELDPTLRAYFAITDMVSQRRQLMRALAKVVHGLNDPDALIPGLEALARRHVDYGMEDHHLATAGAALSWALERGLGSDWDPATRDAWIETYELVSGVMKRAAAEHISATLGWQPVADSKIAA